MSYSDAYVPSWIAVILLNTSLFTLGTVLAGYRETGVVRRFQATPVKPWVVMTAHIAQGTLIFLVSAVILFLFGWFVYDLHVPKYVGSTLLALLISMLAIFPFGMFVTSFAKNTRTAAAIASLFLNLMLFLSGATFPFEMMPNVLQYIGKLLPLYYVVDLLRATWNFTPLIDNWLDVGVLLGIFAVSTVLTTKFFRWNAD
jgi:ABC-2 type transport system permease protein